MLDLKNVLNEKQYEAATYLDGHLRIIAGAGSGKTRVITYRIAYLIDQVGINPRRILAITFTNKAANEMKTRVREIIGDESDGALICTIHSLCVRILRKHIHYLGYPSSFVIMDEDDQKALLKKIYKEQSIDTKLIGYKAMLSYISTMKSAYRDIDELIEMAEDYKEIKCAMIYKHYIAYQKAHYLLDFDDLLLKTNELLDQYDNVRAYWSSCFDYIHVDEYQDTDQQDFKLLKHLTTKDTIVCVVGDPDQTIYSFRGADISYIMKFSEAFGGAKDVYLNENYRSTKSILHAANQLISHNRNRLEKELHTNNTQGANIVHFSADSDEAQGNYVADKIEMLINEIDGINYSDFAVLYRSNYLSRMIENALIQHKIPYRIYGGTKFFSRKEIKDMLSYIRVMAVGEDLAFERIINTPSRKIGAKTLEKIKDFANRWHLSLYEACRDHLAEIGLSKTVASKMNELIHILENAKKMLMMEDAFEYIFNQTGYKEMLLNDHEDDRIANVLELKNAIHNYHLEAAEPSWLDYLQEVALYSAADEQDNNETVSLMTIHMAKGLEFKYVFVIGLSETVFPSQRSIEESGYVGVEEERRLAYVAFTRAQEQLYLVESKGFSYLSDGPKTKSRFIGEIGQEYITHEGEKNRYDDYPIEPMSSSPKSESTQFTQGDVVMHDIFGKGVILRLDGDYVEVAFKVPYGIKKITSNHPTLHLLNKD